MKPRARGWFALCLTAALAAGAAPPVARAGGRFQGDSALWHLMTLCAQYAAKQYPDHTPEGNAKREAVRQDCLRRNHLPVVPQPVETR